MKRSWMLCLGLMVVSSLSACQPGSVAPSAIVSATVTPQISQTFTPTMGVTPTSQFTSTVEPTIFPTIEFTASSPATCQVSSIVPKLPEVLDNLVPTTTENDIVRGPDSALVTFYIYSDYQCPYCAKLWTVMQELRNTYPDEIRVVYRNFPLTSIHDKSALAAQAVDAAGLQNKYWEMQNLLYTQQAQWSGLSVEEFKTWLYSQAVDIDLIVSQFMTDMQSETIVNNVNTEEQNALEMGLASTPAIFVNKFLYQGRNDKDSILALINYFKLEDKAFSSCPEMTVDPSKEYTATLKTEKGDIVIELYPQYAPMTVNNFIFLSNQKWYDNSTFFRVIPGYLVQSGDPTGSSFAWNAGFIYSNEVTPELRFDEPGIVAMFNLGDQMNGAQFFITYTAMPEYDGKYTIFGKVISGMEVLESLRPRNPDEDQILLPADPLLSITIGEQ